MKKVYVGFYTLMILLNLVPFIPMSIKGILGLLFISISSVRLSYKAGLITATLWIMLGVRNFILNINLDYANGLLTMILGSILYYSIAYYLGRTTEALREKNLQLENEVQKRKLTEEQLKKKIILLQSLMDAIPNPIFFMNLEYRYTGCNLALQEATGLKEKEVIGKTVYDLYDLKLANIYHEMDIELLKTTGKQVYETVMRIVDGSLRNVVVNKALFTDGMGNPSGIVGVITDISDKKERYMLEERVVEKRRIIDEILEQDKMKTEFFSNISHELRTPLNVILGSVQLIETYSRDRVYCENQGKVIKNVTIMKQNCYRLLRLVNNLIDITKIDALAFEVHLKNCDVVRIVEEITLSVSNYIENKGIHLIFDTDIEEKIIACDDEKIERIMLNLLSNAVKFTPQRGTILVSIHHDDDHLYIEVKDSGKGIPPEKLQEVFERFCQVTDLFSRHHEGSGIGLSLVKALVEMHGGKISAESELDKGSTFNIQLPTRVVEEDWQLSPPAKQDHVERINVEFSDIYSAG
ncbi:sensor histidine kinase ResE [Clostridium aceticum]|uniref:histidine kinase n=1 Tax=Clostridium aceticum TaxID=84022 RepID=A0A0G3WAM7_9CLOT|nr:ATP-binding protein [Clostridium aceticum]AKL95706.1 sensor histidine kinase ResE [Clostridium aceticum]